METKFKKLKIPSEDRIFSVDPTRFALVLLLTKGSILLHEIRARIHGVNAIRFRIKTKASENRRLMFGKQRAHNSYELCPLAPLYQTHKSCQ